MELKTTFENIKSFQITMIDAQEKAISMTTKAFDSLTNSKFATYTYGVELLNKEVANGARKIIEQFSSFAYAGNKK